jgi:hypothetical protein
LIAGVIQTAESSMSKEVAEATGALLVYADMGGALAVTPGGEVVYYDLDRKVTGVPEEKWRIVALRKAAQKFPELRDLAPERPGNAVSCPACAGRGVVLERFDCGACWGAGWVVSPNEREVL